MIKNGDDITIPITLEIKHIRKTENLVCWKFEFSVIPKSPLFFFISTLITPLSVGNPNIRPVATQLQTITLRLTGDIRLCRKNPKKATINATVPES